MGPLLCDDAAGAAARLDRGWNRGGSWVRLGKVGHGCGFGPSD